jgi:hypothetical protein
VVASAVVRKLIANAYAVELAAKFSAELQVTSVIRPLEFGGTVESTVMLEEGKSRFLEQTASCMSARGMPASPFIAKASPPCSAG